MTLREYWFVIRKRWWIIALAIGTAIGAAAGVNIVTTPMYESTTRLFVSTQSIESTAELLQGSSFTQQRVKSYADIVTSPTVLSPVISDLNLSTNPTDLGARITASVPLNTVIVEIRVQDESPYIAKEIADAVGLSLKAAVASLETPDGEVFSPIKLSVVQPGTLDVMQVSPRQALNLGLGALLGLVLGFGLALLAETLDVRIRLNTNLESLGVKAVLGGIALTDDARKTPLIVHANPKSQRAEAYRHLRTSVQFVQAATGRKSVVISSPMPNEGKTTNTVNLAITFAQAGFKVLLIDADMRKPKIHRYLGLEGAVGLSDVLAGRFEVETVTQRWGDLHLDVLPAGQVPPNPSELLSSQGMERLLEWAEQKYDVVLFDTPPVLPVTDAAILARQTGGMVMVVAIGRSKKSQLGYAISQVEAIDAKVLGVIQNMIPTKGIEARAYKYGYGAGYGSGYGYGYGAYVEAYGQPEDILRRAQSKNSSKAGPQVGANSPVRPPQRPPQL